MAVSEGNLKLIETDSTVEDPSKWRVLLLLSLAELLAISVWFSASAVVPALTEAWNLTDGGQAWLTMSIQIGFVVGAFGSAVLNLADRLPARWLFVSLSSRMLSVGMPAEYPPESEYSF